MKSVAAYGNSASSVCASGKLQAQYKEGLDFLRVAEIPRMGATSWIRDPRTKRHTRGQDGDLKLGYFETDSSCNRRVGLLAVDAKFCKRLLRKLGIELSVAGQA